MEGVHGTSAWPGNGGVGRSPGQCFVGVGSQIPEPQRHRGTKSRCDPLRSQQIEHHPARGRDLYGHQYESDGDILVEYSSTTIVEEHTRGRHPAEIYLHRRSDRDYPCVGQGDWKMAEAAGAYPPPSASGGDYDPRRTPPTPVVLDDDMYADYQSGKSSDPGKSEPRLEEDLQRRRRRTTSRTSEDDVYNPLQDLIIPLPDSSESSQARFASMDNLYNSPIPLPDASGYFSPRSEDGQSWTSSQTGSLSAETGSFDRDATPVAGAEDFTPVTESSSMERDFTPLRSEGYILYKESQRKGQQFCEEAQNLGRTQTQSEGRAETSGSFQKVPYTLGKQGGQFREEVQNLGQTQTRSEGRTETVEPPRKVPYTPGSYLDNKRKQTMAEHKGMGASSASISESSSNMSQKESKESFSKVRQSYGLSTESSAQESASRMRSGEESSSRLSSIHSSERDSSVQGSRSQYGKYRPGYDMTLDSFTRQDLGREGFPLDKQDKESLVRKVLTREREEQYNSALKTSQSSLADSSRERSSSEAPMAGARYIPRDREVSTPRASHSRDTTPVAGYTVKNYEDYLSRNYGETYATSERDSLPRGRVSPPRAFSPCGSQASYFSDRDHGIYPSSYGRAESVTSERSCDTGLRAESDAYSRYGMAENLSSGRSYETGARADKSSSPYGKAESVASGRSYDTDLRSETGPYSSSGKAESVASGRSYVTDLRSETGPYSSSGKAESVASGRSYDTDLRSETGPYSSSGKAESVASGRSYDTDLRSETGPYSSSGKAESVSSERSYDSSSRAESVASENYEGSERGHASNAQRSSGYRSGSVDSDCSTEYEYGPVPPEGAQRDSAGGRPRQPPHQRHHQHPSSFGRGRGSFDKIDEEHETDSWGSRRSFFSKPLLLEGGPVRSLLEDLLGDREWDRGSMFARHGSLLRDDSFCRDFFSRDWDSLFKEDEEFLGDFFKKRKSKKVVTETEEEVHDQGEGKGQKVYRMKRSESTEDDDVLKGGPGRGRGQGESSRQSSGTSSGSGDPTKGYGTSDGVGHQREYGRPKESGAQSQQSDSNVFDKAKFKFGSFGSFDAEDSSASSQQRERSEERKGPGQREPKEKLWDKDTFFFKDFDDLIHRFKDLKWKSAFDSYESSDKEKKDKDKGK